MAPRKSERLLNLTIALLVSRRYVAREQLRSAVEGYSGLSEAAFQRTFERDKDELRALGIPVETGHNDLLFDDEPGYRIRRSDFELPPVELTREERVVLGLAAEVFRDVTLAGSTHCPRGMGSHVEHNPVIPPKGVLDRPAPSQPISRSQNVSPAKTS